MRNKTRGILSGILAAALVFSVFAFQAPEANASAADTGTVNTQGVNLRQQPTTTSAVLVTMEKGASVSVRGDAEGGWYQVTYQAYTGYVRADFIDVMVSGLSAPGVVIEAAEMREQPDAASAVIQTLAPETQVTITGSYGSMYQIEAGLNKGFVPQSSVHQYRIIPLSLSATVNSGTVNLRSIPSTTGEIVATMKRGDTVAAQSIQDHWVKVKYGDKTGYVRGDFLNYTSRSSAGVTEMHPGMRGQAVMTLQVALHKRGFFHVAANGVYGSATKAAVKAFQESVFLDADGIAGVQTLLLLFGSSDVLKLWNNYRTDMEAQAPQQNGQVWLTDWFDTESRNGMQSIMKKGVSFEVIDVRSGIHWNMVRFGDVTAHWHADVCPVTKADTDAMTQAWGGELNASRRPVWVKYDGKYYAASLMGYVHNTDPIGDNGMDGQVCLHFRGSKIHESARVDEAHQACIMEAFNNADRLQAYIDSGKV
jgi:uncharacterized protein YgiM (DUF1202 family)